MASIDEIVETIKEIDLKPGEVELLEDCEMVTNIIIGQVLQMISDPKMREDILWLQEQHRKPNAKRWNRIVKLTEELFEKSGGGERVKSYHLIEAPCRDVPLEDIKAVSDPKIRETIMKIRHIHDDPLERITRIASKCYFE